MKICCSSYSVLIHWGTKLARSRLLGGKKTPSHLKKKEQIALSVTCVCQTHLHRKLLKKLSATRVHACLFVGRSAKSKIKLLTRSFNTIKWIDLFNWDGLSKWHLKNRNISYIIDRGSYIDCPTRCEL